MAAVALSGISTTKNCACSAEYFEPAYRSSSSEKRVHGVVMKQAALAVERLRSGGTADDLRLPPETSYSLKEAYDRCGRVCAEYAKTFYVGTLLMTPVRRKAIWAIYGI